MPLRAMVWWMVLLFMPLRRIMRFAAVPLEKHKQQKSKKIYELAIQSGAPVVGVYDSDGAKLGEGIDAMDAIAELLLACNQLSGVVPQIAVVAGPCVGSSALSAANADIVVAVEKADYYLNVGDKNTDAAITAANADEAMDKVRELLALLPSNNLTSAVTYDFDSSVMGNCETIDGVIEAVSDADSVVELF